MLLDKLLIWPTKKTTRLILIICIILLIAIYPIITYLFTFSYPVSFIESQLSFSGQLIKQYNAIANIELYRIANILDYIFMVSYGGIFFSLGLIITRKFEKESIWCKISLNIVPLAIVAPISDAIENLFILLMLSNPLEFPDIWAIIHSCFSLVKFTIMFIGFGWIFIALIKILINRFSDK